ncbi:MAG: F0F1 ATP synthase subunit epsilon [Syntrophobacteria bacterium]
MNEAMDLTVLLPTGVFLAEKVEKVTAEAANGYFCLLPRHIDFVAALVPGLLFYEASGGKETFLAVDEGILVKQGRKVVVSTRNAVRGPDLGMLRRTVEEEFEMLDDREKKVRSAAAKIEASFVKRFLELREHG